MHLLVRESRSLDAESAAQDLAHDPAAVLLLSFSDSDLGAAASAWERWADGERPSLRLLNLRRLRHPMSVDLYLERMLPAARCVIVRLLGGLEYWRYGADEIAAACRARGIALALLPGDGRDDAALQALSTIGASDWATLSACLEQGGPENMRRALLLAERLGGVRAGAEVPALALPAAGECPLASDEAGWGRAALVFYRSHLQAGDIAPAEALAAALAARGMAVRAFFVASLKEPASAEFVAARLRAWQPHVVVNMTAFSSPLDAAGAPVLQAVLAGSAREDWATSLRGLSGTDLAMHVVLPELDGRLLTTAVSFKQEVAAIAGLDFSRTIHAPDSDGIALAADRAAGWARLAATACGSRVIACVLSDYPGGGRVGQAVGLDTFASLSAILSEMAAAGYATLALAPERLVERLCSAPAETTIELAAYRKAFRLLPEPERDAMTRAWGEPEADPAFVEGAFRLRWWRSGNVVMAVQPDRGSALDRKAGYHDPDCPPRHAYVAFYWWLRSLGVHAMVQVGAHGTLEWLPGKSVALSPSCFPSLLTGGLPVIYPFIVNNPGEAAAAKRRLGAVTIGHLTPTLREAGNTGAAQALELRLEEYAAADGMDRRRLALLKREILEGAAADGLLGESGAKPEWSEDDRLARLDAYLCDVKEAQIRDGLHVFGQGAPGEMAGLLEALAGRFVPPGPAGAPSRGRPDVLPTGRNLYSVDPRSVPTATAMRLAERTAAELLRKHLQDHGEYPRTLVLNLWGSTTMRTGGEDLALALVLLGAKAEWDPGSGRVTGFEVLPIALLERPRVDVTLRISGLFRDAFALQIALFDAVARAVAGRDEAADWNPLAGAPDAARIYGPAPGTYGAGVSALLESGRWGARGEIGAAYLQASETSYGQGNGDFAARARVADAFVQIQDHGETDLLESGEWAAHAGGFAALAERIGAAPALYHCDTAKQETPVVRGIADEVVRMTRARIANPEWLRGMMRHGYRGAAEIARGIDGLYGYAACLSGRFDRQFDLLWDATLGDATVDAFLQTHNPAAREAIAARFAEARQRGLWHSRRNDLGDGR